MASSHVRPDPNVVAERVHDEMVLVHLGTNAIYALSPTAARAWELLAEGSPPGAIVTGMQDEYEVTVDELEGEIDRLFAALTDAGLVIPEPA